MTFGLCGEHRRVLLRTGGLVWLRLGARQQLKCRSWGLSLLELWVPACCQSSQEVHRVKNTLEKSMSASFEGL